MGVRSTWWQRGGYDGERDAPIGTGISAGSAIRLERRFSAIIDAALHSAVGRHRVRASVERYYRIERPQREQVVSAVGYRVERMACAERSELVVLSHDLLHLLDGRGVEHVPRDVADVARSVRGRHRGRRIQKRSRSMFDLTGRGGKKIGLQRHVTKLLRCAVGGNRRPEEKAKTQKDNAHGCFCASGNVGSRIGSIARVSTENEQLGPFSFQLRCISSWVTTAAS